MNTTTVPRHPASPAPASCSPRRAASPARTRPTSSPRTTSRSICSERCRQAPRRSPWSTGSASTRICLVGADDLIHPVDRSVRPGYQPIELVDALTAGPSDAERSFGLTTALADPGTVTAIDIEGGVATVDLDAALAARPTTDQLTVVTQLVCTLTGQPGIGQVRFTVDRLPIAVPRGDGSSTSDPVSRQDYDSLISST